MSPASPNRFVLPTGLRRELDVIAPLNPMRAGEGDIADWTLVGAKLDYGSEALRSQVLTEALTDLRAATEFYCNDIATVLGAPEYMDYDPGADPTPPRPPDELGPHAGSGRDFRGWLALAHEHAPAEAEEALGEVVQRMIEVYVRDEFRMAAWVRNSPDPEMARNLQQDAKDILADTVYNITHFSTDPSLARLLMDTDFFADYGKAPDRLRLLQHIVTHAGTKDEHGRPTPEYTKMIRLAGWYVSRLSLNATRPPVDYSLLTLHNPGMLQAIAERDSPRNPARADLVGTFGAKAILGIPKAVRTPEQTAELTALEQSIASPDAWAEQLEARLKQEGPITDRELATLERRIRQCDFLDNARKLVLLGMALLPVRRVERLAYSNPALLTVPKAGAIAVRRLARHSDMRGAHEMTLALDMVNRDAPWLLYNLLAIYEESGDTGALQEAQERRQVQYNGWNALARTSDQEYLTRLYLAARRQENDASGVQALVDLLPYHNNSSPVLRYKALRQMMQVRLDLGDISLAQDLTKRIHDDREFTREQRLEATLYTIIRRVEIEDHDIANRLLTRYLPADHTRMQTLLEWLHHLDTREYPLLPTHDGPQWDVEFDPTRRYRTYAENV